MSEASPVRVAVIGAGNMGRHHVRNYAAIPEAKLVAVADLNPATKQLAAQHSANHYADYLEMLEKEKPDAVTVALPTSLHGRVGVEVMSRGIHCLLEKPMAQSLDEADELIQVASQNKVVFTIGHIERYNPVVRRLRELIEGGRLGDVTSIVSKRVGGFPAIEPSIGVILELAVHDIDIMSFLLGVYPQGVYAHSSRTLHSNDIDAAEILLDYGSASGFIQANWTTPVKIRSIAVTGSAGYVEGNYITQELIYYEHNQPHLDGDYKKEVSILATPKKQVIPIDFQEPLEIELTAFLQTVQGQVRERLVSPTDAREALRIALESLPHKAPKQQVA